jgi:hypothetical protein
MNIVKKGDFRMVADEAIATATALAASELAEGSLPNDPA